MSLRNDFCTVEEAVKELQNDRFIIVVDDEKRENEGDLIIPAENATPVKINFMIKEGGGLICVPINKEIAEKLELKLMVEKDKNDECTQCNFTIPVDYKSGVKTGISAHDRAKTIKAIAAHDSIADHFAKPGHVFPLIAEDGGVNSRPGHTEAAIDLMKLSGFIPAACICEILNSEGRSANMPELFEFASKFDLKILEISSLIDYMYKLKL